MATFMVLLALLLVLALHVYRSIFYWKRRGVPQETSLTPMGDFIDVGFRYHWLEKLDILYTKFKHQGPLFGMYAIMSSFAIFTDLDVIRSVLIKDFSYFVDRGLFHTDDDVLTQNLLNIESDKWKRMRNFLTPTFTSGKMKGMFFIVEEKGRDLVDFLSRHSAGPVESRDALSKFTCDVVASVAFGLETSALKNDGSVVLDMLTNAFFGSSVKDSLNFLVLTNFPKLSARLGLRQFSKELEQFFIRTITDTIEYREKNKIVRGDFLNMLINLKNRGTISDTGEANDAEKLQLEEILPQAFAFFVAGFDTSSTTMSFATYFLARHSEVQTRLRDEVRATKAKNGGKIDYEGLMGMTYLNQVFNETLRLYPPVQSLLREAKADYTVPGTSVVIPKGTKIQVPSYSIHRDERFWPNPLKFDPNRFSAEQSSKRHPFAFLPFGDGPRSCIGMRFAQLQSKYGLAVIVDNFELTVSPKTSEPLKLKIGNLNTEVEGGLWINFKKL